MAEPILHNMDSKIVVTSSTVSMPNSIITISSSDEDSAEDDVIHIPGPPVPCVSLLDDDSTNENSDNNNLPEDYDIGLPPYTVENMMGLDNMISHVIDSDTESSQESNRSSSLSASRSYTGFNDRSKSESIRSESESIMSESISIQNKSRNESRGKSRSNSRSSSRFRRKFSSRSIFRDKSRSMMSKSKENTNSPSRLAESNLIPKIRQRSLSVNNKSINKTSLPQLNKLQYSNNLRSKSLSSPPTCRSDLQCNASKRSDKDDISVASKRQKIDFTNITACPNLNIVTSHVNVSYNITNNNRSMSMESIPIVADESKVEFRHFSVISEILKHENISTNGTINDGNVPTILAKENCRAPPIKEDSLSNKESNSPDDNSNSSHSKSNGRTSMRLNDPEIAWNDEMKHFYNESWGREVDEFEIRRNMSASDDWHIKTEDEFAKEYEIIDRKPLAIGKCTNCRSFGHVREQCLEPERERRCSMCGKNEHHRDKECPDKCCLRCGTAQVFNYCRGCDNCYHKTLSSCTLCNGKGHERDECPDQWRRYHSTTKSNVPLTVASEIPNKAQFCCLCAGAGHRAEYCDNDSRPLVEICPDLNVYSHDQVYDRLSENGESDEEEKGVPAPFALMSVPSEQYRFNWSVNEDPNRFYGRFLRGTTLRPTPTLFNQQCPDLILFKVKEERSEKLNFNEDEHNSNDEVRLSTIDDEPAELTDEMKLALEIDEIRTRGCRTNILQ